ncbi:MAG: hypothetical protein R3E64_12365 [Halioglobus sp.]
MKNALITLALASSLTLTSVLAVADSDREAAKTKAASIPDKVQTAAGELNFFDGVPVGNTNDLVYDYLDRSRALGVYLDNVGCIDLQRPAGNGAARR